VVASQVACVVSEESALPLTVHDLATARQFALLLLCDETLHVPTAMQAALSLSFELSPVQVPLPIHSAWDVDVPSLHTPFAMQAASASVQAPLNFSSPDVPPLMVRAAPPLVAASLNALVALSRT